MARPVELVKTPVLDVSSRLRVRSSSNPSPNPRNVMAPSPSSESFTPAEPTDMDVVNVGAVAKTKRPVPVSSVTAEMRLELEGVAKKVATPVPRPLTPVLIGKPVALVRVPDAGVPNAGVTNVGDVPKTRAPVPVSSEMADAMPEEVVMAVTADVPLPKRIPVIVVAPVPPLATDRALVVSVREPKLPAPVVVNVLEPKSTLEVAPV